MKEDYDILDRFLKKRTLTYSEFNELIGNYFVEDYEELDENYYIIRIIRPLEESSRIYTDYVQVIKN